MVHQAISLTGATCVFYLRVSKIVISHICLSSHFPVLSLDRSWSKLSCIRHCHHVCLSPFSLFYLPFCRSVHLNCQLTTPSTCCQSFSPSSSFDIFIMEISIIHFILLYYLFNYIIFSCVVDFISTSQKYRGHVSILFPNVKVLMLFKILV